jgi:hypothetical protein
MGQGLHSSKNFMSDVSTDGFFDLSTALLVVGFGMALILAD